MHCPQCGTPAVEGASVCTACGTALPWAPARPAPAASAGAPAAKAGRTMIGLSAEDAARLAAPAPAALAPAGIPAGTIVGGTPVALAGLAPAAPAGPGPQAAGRTIVGMRMSPVSAAPAAGAPRAGAPAGAAGRTMLGVAAPSIGAAAASFGAATPGPVAPEPAARTMLGVAMPGIAPLNPGAAPRFGVGSEGAGDGYASAELGATAAPVGPGRLAIAPDASFPGAPALYVPRERSRAAPSGAPPPVAPPASSRKALVVVGAAGVLAVGAVLFAVLWPSAPPLTVRARADAEGREGIEVTCASCPDGTTVSVGQAPVAMARHVAQVPLATPLSVGENRLTITIDRPGNGRDETVGVDVPLGYRIRPDLETLQGERPAIQIVVEAQPGTSVTLAGKPVALAAGRAVETVDVTEGVTGVADEVATLSRQVPYSVTPKDGAPEQGMVNVSVSVVPLHLDAPGPTAVTDGKTFVLAGRSLKGAEVLAAGRPIQVKPDGTFAQVMNVSSVGATQIEVRARMANMAPRITRIDVRRVDSLETAAREFAAKAPLGWADVAPSPAAVAGKPVLLGGEVAEVRRQSHQTVMLLDVAPSFGCKAQGAGPDACRVRLVQGADNPAKQGDTIRVYGHVARAYAVPGRADIPEVWVDFTLKGLR